MENALSVLLAVYIAVTLMVTRRAFGRTTTLRQYFSFGPSATVQDLEKTFEASNASFMTAFLSLFLYVPLIGWEVVWIPIGFCVGILFYTWVVLPRQLHLLVAGKRFPEVLAEYTGEPRLRYFTAAFVVANVWLFLYAEVQGVLLFLGALFGDSAVLVAILPITVVALIAIYTALGGFQAVYISDKYQAWAIRAGTLSLAIMVAYLAVEAELDVGRLPDVRSTIGSLGSVSQTFLAFAFAQLLYYENWQRLSFFFSSNSDLGVNQAEEILSKVQRSYSVATGTLLVIYTMPIAIGLLQVAAGNHTGGADALAAFFGEAWAAVPFGPALVMLVFLQLLSALMSTADTLVVCAANAIIEDLFGLSVSVDDSSSETGPKAQLAGVRVLAVLISMSVLPFVFLRFDFENLFTYIFYSANGFVGPLLYSAVFNRQLHPAGTCAAIAAAFILPAIPLMLGIAMPLWNYAGLITVGASLFLAYLGSQPRLRGEI